MSFAIRAIAATAALFYSTAVLSNGMVRVPDLGSGGASWLLRAQPIATDGNTATVNVNDFVFIQPLAPAAEGVPAAGQTGILPGNFGNQTTVNLDDYRFALTVGGVTDATYCSIQDNIAGRGKRLCLIDVNDDGKFDFQGRAIALGFGEPFSVMLVGPSALPTSISYTTANRSPNFLMYAGIVIRKEGKSYAIRFAVSEKGKPKYLDLFEPEERFLQERRADVGRLHFSADRLPARVELYGAVIEVIAIAGDKITYRLLSAFDQRENIVVSRAGRLPILP